MLKITDFSKTYKGGKKAVSHLNLEILPGDIYGFIGHNGAGKTTTIKAAVGILDFEEGEILIDGHSIEKEPLLCKSMLAYIPDNPDLYEHLTGIQYLNFIADIFRLDSGVRTERIREYAEQFGITDSLGDLISSYSHGMKQKLAIISALIHKPKLLVLDEPVNGLDPLGIQELRHLIRSFPDQGITVLVSSHILSEIQQTADYIGIIANGKLGYEGIVDESQDLEQLFMKIVAVERGVR